MDISSETAFRFERAKLLHDYFKYLTTISTGSVVFLVTFSNRFSEPETGIGWLAASIVLFMVCVMSSVAAQTAYIWYASSEPRKVGKYIYQLGLFGSWMGLMGGVICLVIFALKRLGVCPSLFG
jgi:hypothetical protein